MLILKTKYIFISLLLLSSCKENTNTHLELNNELSIVEDFLPLYDNNTDVKSLYVEDNLINKNVKYIINHYTNCQTYKRTIELYKQNKVSAHLTIEKDGKIYYNVHIKDMARHAGLSAFRKDGSLEDYDKSLNNCSIGIENVNPGFFSKTEYKNYKKTREIDWGKPLRLLGVRDKWWLKFSEEQFIVNVNLIKKLQEHFKIPGDHVLTHADIAITRKLDTGPMWDYRKAYEDYDVGYFYKYLKNINLHTKKFSKIKNKHYIELIRKFGYVFNTSDKNEVEQGIRAFQMHYGHYPKGKMWKKDISGKLTNITKKSILSLIIDYHSYVDKYRGTLNIDLIKEIDSYLKKEGIFEIISSYF